MDSSDKQLLANIAIIGSNLAETQSAQVIIDALKLHDTDNEAIICAQAINEFNQGQFNEAVKTLGPWCDKNTPGVAHGMLALTYWQWGRLADAEQYCKSILDASNDERAIALAEDIMNQLG